MIKKIFAFIGIGLFCSCSLLANESEVEVVKIKRSAVVKKLQERVKKSSEGVQPEYTSIFKAFDDVLEDIIDEAEFETSEYGRNDLKRKFEVELGECEIAVPGGVGVITNAWGAGRTYTTFKTIRVRESDAFDDTIKFSIKLYDSYIKNGYTQIDALKEMQKCFQRFVKEQEESAAKEEKKQESKKKAKSNRRNVPSTWRSYR